MTDNERMIYATAEPEERYKLCSTAHTKIAVVKSILERHPGEPTLVIGAYLDQLDELGAELERPGHPGLHQERRARGAVRRSSAAARFRPWWCPRSRTSPSTCRKPSSRCRCRARSGRGRRRRSGWAGCCAPRPTAAAHFYSVVSRDSLDAEYAAHRQRFLAEQGYGYVIKDADDLLGPAI